MTAWVLTRDREDAGDKTTDKSRPAEAGASVRSGEDTSHETGGMLPGKSAGRPLKPATSLQKTLELLRDTVIPVASYPEQTLGERIAAINRHVEDVGIPPEKLSIGIHPGLAKESEPSNWRFESLELRHVPVAEILKYTCGSTKIRYHVRPGKVDFALASDLDPYGPAPKALAPGEPDPFESDPTPVE